MPYRDYRIRFEAFIKGRWVKEKSSSIGMNAKEAIAFWKKANKGIKEPRVRNVTAKRLKTYHGKRVK